MTNDADGASPAEARPDTGPPDHDVQPALGRRLRELRLRRGLSQSALAGDVVSPSAISLLESGHRQPTQRTLHYLAQQLGCTVEFLRDGVEPAGGATLRLALARTELAVLSGDAETARVELNAVTGDGMVHYPGYGEQVRLLRALIAELTGEPEDAVRLLEGLVDAMPASWRGTGEEDGPDAEADADRRSSTDPDSAFPCPPTAVFAALARGYRALGRPEDAARAARQGLALLASLRLDEDCYAAELREVLLLAMDELGAPAAEAVARRTLAAGGPADSEAGRVHARLAAASRAREQGLVTEALRIVESTRAVVLFGQERRRAARFRATAALLLYGRGDGGDDVVDALHASCRELSALGDAATAGRCAAALAEVALREGDLEAARQLAERSLDALSDADPGAPLAEVRIRLMLGRIRAEAGDREAAGEQATAAAEVLRRVPEGREAADAWRETGELLERAGDAEGALAAFRKALGAVGIGRS
ncbi:helix-turn-helix domain-containing protein [Streptomyces sp. NPDC093546]|uniref:helix-turn-helix domain-containing protein n=1 Tax=Streptomyces sp. NPDC093546 TaxID=3366040 RepID=UPI00380AD428